MLMYGDKLNRDEVARGSGLSEVAALVGRIGRELTRKGLDLLPTIQYLRLRFVRSALRYDTWMLERSML